MTLMTLKSFIIYRTRKIYELQISNIISPLFRILLIVLSLDQTILLYTYRIQ